MMRYSRERIVCVSDIYIELIVLASLMKICIVERLMVFVSTMDRFNKE